MLDLFTMFTPLQIVTFIIVFIVAIKAFWELIDFFKNKYQEKFNKDHQILTKDEELTKHYEECKNQRLEAINLYNSVNDKLDTLSNSIEQLSNRVDRLTVSDRNDIRQFIVREYHYFTEEKGWIDDYSLDSILQRYEDYKDEGGNSYVHTLIDELKRLPKKSPSTKKE